MAGLGDYSGMQRFEQSLGTLGAGLMERQRRMQEMAIDNQIKGIMARNTVKNPDGTVKMNREGIASELQGMGQAGINVLGKLSQMWNQEDMLKSKGETQGPAAQVFVDLNGQAWQLGKSEGKPVAYKYMTEEGTELPKSAIKSQTLTGDDGIMYAKPEGSNSVIPLVKEGTNEPLVNPDVQKGKTELGIKQTELQIQKKKAERAEKEAEKQDIKEKINIDDTILNFQDYANKARVIANDPNLWQVTGAGKVLSLIPGTPGADLAAKLKTLKSKAAVNTLQKLKESSKAGASGFGALSERELDVLIDAYTTLQTSQSPPALKSALEDIIIYSKRVQNQLAQGKESLNDLGKKYGF